MARYKLTATGVHDTQTGFFIPNSPDNAMWNDYLAWVAQGNTADPLYTLEQKRENRKEDVNKKKQTIIAAGVSFNSKVYNADHDAFTKYLAADKTTKVINIVAKDGSVNVLTKQNISDLIELVSDLIHECEIKMAALFVTIDASGTPESVDIDTGWPTVPYTGA